MVHEDDAFTLVRLALFFALFAVDLGFSSAAGAAAAATGAHVNAQSSSATSQIPYSLTYVLQLGALAGVLKAAILGLLSFGREFGGMNIGMHLLLLVVFSSFGICAIVTSAVANIIWGYVPGGLLIAAVVTAIPLSAELVTVQLTGEGNISINLGIIGTDALSGFVFAHMALNEGYDICSFGAAAAAGAVFGTIMLIKATIFGVFGSHEG